MSEPFVGRDRFAALPEGRKKQDAYRLMLDGGGDWQLSPAGASWICPNGLYEVYARSSTGITLNGILCSSASAYWAPYTFGGIPKVVTEWTGAGSTPEVYSATAFDLATSGVCTCPRGWLLCGGDVLTGAGTMIVRFRRIG